MIILGVNASHTATACLLVNGEIVACISEERLSRLKSQAGLPILAIKEVLRISGYKVSEIDLLVFGFKDPKVNSCFAALRGTRDKKSDPTRDSSFEKVKKISWFLKEELLVRIPFTKNIYNSVMPMLYNLLDKNLQEKLLLAIEQIGIPGEKVEFVDHHTAHANSAIFSSPQFGKKPLLCLTLDGMGDGFCSTVCIVKNKQIKLIAKTPQGNSLGDLYSFVTYYLGMRMGEHEYKVMGLASYTDPKHAEKLYLRLKELIWVNNNLTFSTSVHSFVFHKILPKILKHERFDNIAAAIQLLTERLLVEWVEKAVKLTGIHDLVCAGGVFMNVKANQKILESPMVRSLYVVPSSGDETTAIGAAYWGYDRLGGEWGNIKPLEHLYLGTNYSNADITKEIKKISRKKYQVEKVEHIEKEVARLLSKGNVVARFYGPMEFGARALGNRSILAHPANLDCIREINETIKSRDFWMPFAPSILEERQNDYFINPKNYPANFMTITFVTTKKGKQDLKAAMHRYDFTLRPQIVKKDVNPSYHRIITEFQKLTGIGAVLNTSFNLHGYPIVMSPKDALEVLENSGLKYLAIGDFLIWKKDIID